MRKYEKSTKDSRERVTPVPRMVRLETLNGAEQTTAPMEGAEGAPWTVRHRDGAYSKSRCGGVGACPHKAKLCILNCVYNITSMSNIPIFVINLARSSLRKKQMAFQLTRLGLEHEFVPAVDGASLDDATLVAIENNRDAQLYAKPFTVGEIGCGLSHLAVYKKICDDAIPCALILEDDVFLEAQLAHIVDAPVIAQMPKGWDMLLCAYVQRGNMYSKPYKHARIQWSGRTRLVGGHGNCFTAGFATEFCYHTAAYIVSQAGAQKFCEIGSPMKMPADILTGNAHAYGMKAYVLQKPCARQHVVWAQTSTIKEHAQEHKKSIRKKAVRYIRAHASKNMLFYGINLFMRMVLVCGHFSILVARGHRGPVPFLRKLGIVPRQIMKREKF